MRKYTMSAQTPKGLGDRGSDWLCVMNNEPVPTRQIAVNVARRLSEAKQTRVMLWEGKRNLIWDSAIWDSFGQPVIDKCIHDLPLESDCDQCNAVWFKDSTCIDCDKSYQEHARLDHRFNLGDLPEGD